MQTVSPAFAKATAGEPAWVEGWSLLAGALRRRVGAMFPLKTATFPSNASDLSARLNESLREVFNLSRDPVELREITYPHLAEMRVSLDGATLAGRPPAPPRVSGQPVPALTVDSFAATGAGVSVGPAAVDFALRATGLELDRAEDKQGNVVLLLQNAAQGQVEISTSVAGLEALIAEVASAEAGKHGVAVDKVQLALRSSGPRSLAAEVRLRGRKLFMSAALRITGQLDLDEELNARLSGLDCTGEGAIAGIACGFLKPQLQKMEGRVFPMMSLPLGQVRLRDVRIAAGENLSVTAEFGSAA